MSRPKKYPERTVIALPDGTFDAINRVLGTDEDRATFVRDAVELLIELRHLEVYQDLLAHLLANETPTEFVLKSTAKYTTQRKEALAGSGTTPARKRP